MSEKSNAKQSLESFFRRYEGRNPLVEKIIKLTLGPLTVRIQVENYVRVERRAISVNS